MRPGKPLLFGAVGETPVFGMPGNPSSVFVGFSIFVAPALARIGGETRNRPRWFRVRYGADHPPRGREEFARVVLQNGENGLVAMPVAEQGSFGLRSIGQADAIVRLRADVAIHQGDWCEAMLLRIP
jgi:molybdopterin molybdotransferase